MRVAFVLLVIVGLSCASIIDGVAPNADEDVKNAVKFEGFQKAAANLISTIVDAGGDASEDNRNWKPLIEPLLVEIDKHAELGAHNEHQALKDLGDAPKLEDVKQAMEEFLEKQKAYNCAKANGEEPAVEAAAAEETVHDDKPATAGEEEPPTGNPAAAEEPHVDEEHTEAEKPHVDEEHTEAEKPHVDEEHTGGEKPHVDEEHTGGEAAEVHNVEEPTEHVKDEAVHEAVETHNEAAAGETGNPTGAEVVDEKKAEVVNDEKRVEEDKKALDDAEKPAEVKAAEHKLEEDAKVLKEEAAEVAEAEKANEHEKGPAAVKDETAQEKEKATENGNAALTAAEEALEWEHEH